MEKLTLEHTSVWKELPKNLLFSLVHVPGGGVYDLYCSQTPGGKDVLASLLGAFMSSNFIYSLWFTLSGILSVKRHGPKKLTFLKTRLGLFSLSVWNPDRGNYTLCLCYLTRRLSCHWWISTLKTTGCTSYPQPFTQSAVVATPLTRRKKWWPGECGKGHNRR